MGKKVMIIGSGGRLGCELVELFGPCCLAVTHRELDITVLDAVQAKIAELSPQLIINCAAVTDVDAAEKDPDRAFGVNALGARNLAEAAREVDADLVYVSTDYVFDGKKGSPYLEEDPPNPVNHYGRSKLTGEYITCHLWKKAYIIRTGILYGRFGPNYLQHLIDTLVEQRSITAIADQAASPTSTNDLAQAIQTVINSGKYGTYHMVNKGRATRYELAKVVQAAVGRLLPEAAKLPLNAISLARAGKLAARPADTTLSCSKLQHELAYPMRDWEEPVREYVKYYLQEKISGRLSGV